MKRVQNMILLHGVAFVARWIASDTKKNVHKNNNCTSDNKEHSVKNKVKHICLMLTTTYSNGNCKYLII